MLVFDIIPLWFSNQSLPFVQFYTKFVVGAQKGK